MYRPTVKQGRAADDSDGYSVNKMTVTQLRWDHADLLLYRSINALNLQSVLDEIVQLEQSRSVTPASIDDINCRVLNILRLGSDIAVPKCSNNFLSTGGIRS